MAGDGTGSLKEFILKFCQEHWPIVMLFILLLILAGAHAFMIHYNRPETTINWCEGMITGTFTALIAKLKD